MKIIVTALPADFGGIGKLVVTPRARALGDCRVTERSPSNITIPSIISVWGETLITTKPVVVGVPSQTITLDENQYGYVLQTKDDETSVSERVRELVELGIESETE